MTSLEKEIVTARYHNTNRIGIAIVAVLTRGPMDNIFHWSAYIGAATNPEHKHTAIVAARRWGNKLSPYDARHYFPQFPIQRYRE